MFTGGYGLGIEDKKILLMLPLESRPFHEYPDIGLGYLAGALIERGVKKENIRIICKGLSSWDFRKFDLFLEKERPDVVGVKAFSVHAEMANKTLERVRNILPGTLRVLGGSHSSTVLDGVFKTVPTAQYAFRGECENVFGDFLEAYFNGDMKKCLNVKGLIYRGENDNIVVNDIAIVDDLDRLPMPAWELLKPEETIINPFQSISKRHPIAPIVFSRGCSFQCTFCSVSNINGHMVRCRTPEKVLDEMELLYKEYGIREFHMVDNNAITDKSRFVEFCQGIIDRKLRISWACPHGIRTETIDEELAKLMKKSGCYYVSMGIESGDNDVLRKIKKAASLEKLQEKISVLNKAGIKVYGFFIIGFPGETREQMQRTYEYAKRIDIFLGVFFRFILIPGTEICRELVREGKVKIGQDITAHFSGEPSNYSEISDDDLTRMQWKAFWTLALRPRVIAYYFSHMWLSFRVVKQIYKTFKDRMWLAEGNRI